MTPKECLNCLMDYWNYAQSIAIMANIEAESDYHEDALGDKNSKGEFTSYGLCQWHGSRWERLKKYAGTDGAIDPDVQVGFIVYEMEKWYPKTWKIFQEIGNDKAGAERAAYYFCYNYEVPANRQSKSEKRSIRAGELYEQFENKMSAEELICKIEEIIKQWKK